MSPDDKFLIVAKRADAAIDPMQKVHFRSTLAGAEGLALNIIRRLTDGFNGSVRGIRWEVCIFDLTLVKVVKPAYVAGDEDEDADNPEGNCAWE